MGIRRGVHRFVEIWLEWVGCMEGKASLKDTRLHLVYKYIMEMGKVTLEAEIQDSQSKKLIFSTSLEQFLLHPQVF
jgi:hypothetical protein